METKNKDIKEITLNESIISIRVELQNSKIKKSGKNSFAGFSYYELADFLPKLNELMQEKGVNDRFTIENSFEGDYAKLELIKGEEKQEYKMPFKIFETPLNFKKDKNGNFIKDKNESYIEVKSMQDIQYLGALNTYYKRYLYLNAFGITDGEVIDAMDNDDLPKKQEPTTKKNETTIDYKKRVQNFIKENNLNAKEVCTKYKLNAKSTQKEFENAYNQLLSIATAPIGERLGKE